GPRPKLDPASDPDFAALGCSVTDVFFGSQGDTHLYLAEGPAERLLVFRGSLTLPNWLVNVSFDFAPWDAAKPDFGRGHAGFAAAGGGVRARVWAGLAAAPAKPLWIAGHSLGGALAVLAARDLALHGFPVLGVHTFGGPRAGDAAFAAGWSVPVERWVNHQ